MRAGSCASFVGGTSRRRDRGVLVRLRGGGVRVRVAGVRPLVRAAGVPVRVRDRAGRGGVASGRAGIVRSRGDCGGAGVVCCSRPRCCTWRWTTGCGTLRPRRLAGLAGVDGVPQFPGPVRVPARAVGVAAGAGRAGACDAGHCAGAVLRRAVDPAGDHGGDPGADLHAVGGRRGLHLQLRAADRRFRGHGRGVHVFGELSNPGHHGHRRGCCGSKSGRGRWWRCCSRSWW